MNAVLIDTNVLVYRRDYSEPIKSARAAEVLKSVNGAAVLTTQVLGEYFSVVRRKFAHQASLANARREVLSLAAAMEVLPVTLDVTLEAVRGVEEHGLSFYDAQIWAAARLNGVPIVLTEDFTHGRVVEGVRYVDPFCPQFDMAELG